MERDTPGFGLIRQKQRLERQTNCEPTNQTNSDSFFCSKPTIRLYYARGCDGIMKRALLVWAASASLAVAQGNVSSEFQNAPRAVAESRQPAQPAPPPPQPAQPQPAQGAPASSSGQSGSPGGGSSFLGKDVPLFDPGSNIVTWDGKSWNISNNALFQARFEKYLNAPPAISPPEAEYQETLRQIMEKLSPGKITPRSTDEAFQLLAKASRYQDDANLCDSIANQVYSAWLARKNNDRLNAASKTLEDEKKRLEWNARLTAEGTQLEGSSGGSSSSKGRAPQTKGEQRQQPGNAKGTMGLVLRPRDSKINS